MKLTLVLAARGRPEALKWTLENTLKHKRLQDTTLMVALDDDDPGNIEVAKEFEVLLSVKPREDTVAEKYNRALVEAPADVYMPMQDTAPHITPGFDEIMLEAAGRFPDGIGVAYNHYPCLSFPGAQALTAGLVAKLGWIYPPYFPYWFVDHWIDDVVRLIDRISFADCQQHYAGHLTHERREAAFWASFYDFCALERRRQARSIIDSPEFQEPEWRKEVLRRSFPMVEYRSVWINNEVRRMHLADPKKEGGERYARIKKKALAMIERLLPALEAEHAQHEEKIRAAA